MARYINDKVYTYIMTIITIQKYPQGFRAVETSKSTDVILSVCETTKKDDIIEYIEDKIKNM